MAITSTSIVSHVGMRFTGSVMACASAAHVMYRMAAIGCERIHMSCRLGPKGVDRMGDEDADAYYDQACHRGLEQHRGGFRLVAIEWAIPNRQILLALGRSDGTSMKSSLQIRNRPLPPRRAKMARRPSTTS